MNGQRNLHPIFLWDILLTSGAGKGRFPSNKGKYIWEVGVGIWNAYQNPHPYHPHNSHVVYWLPGLLRVQHFRARDIRDDSESIVSRWE